MSRPDTRVWARHYQDDWQARAGDPRMPYWLRVASLAFGSHANNGHARFKRGEIALILATVDRESGEVRPFANVRREIARAVEYGWLEEGSYWGCLIVPAHSILKGELTSKRSPCPLDSRHRDRAKRSLSERNEVLTPTPDERFKIRTVHSVSGSERAHLSSVLSPTAEQEAAS